MPKTNTEDVVWNYMKSQNRPYSALDIHMNLHKAEGKTAVVRALEKLAGDGKLLEKCYGKTKIYVVHQSQFPDVDEKDIKKMDADIVQYTQELSNLQSANKTLTADYKALESSLTTEQAVDMSEELEKEIASLEEKSANLKAAAKNFDASKKDDIMKNRLTQVGHWKKRKRMATDMMNAILEGYPKSKKQFFEEVGIETDEEMKVSIPAT